MLTLYSLKYNKVEYFQPRGQITNYVCVKKILHHIFVVEAVFRFVMKIVF